MKSSDKVGDIIVRLKSENKQAKLDEHYPYIPHKADELLKKQVFAYYGSDRKRTIFNPANCICIELDEVKFYPMLARDHRMLQDSYTPVEELIEFQKIYPFMLFLDGRFIPWENISLIISYGKYYFFIENLDIRLNREVRTIDYMNLITLPTNIIYSIGVEDENDEYVTLFSFNYAGLLVEPASDDDLDVIVEDENEEEENEEEEDWIHRFYIPRTANTSVTTVENLTNLRTFSIDDFDYKYKVGKENFLFWNDIGLYCSEPYMENLGRLFKVYDVPDGDSVLCKIITCNSSTPSIDNMNYVDYDLIKDDLPAVLVNNNPKEYITSLTYPFNLQMDKNKSYEENRKEAIDYILSYRTDLFYELYEYELKFFTLGVDYNWITTRVNSDGYLRISRMSSIGKAYYIILLVNGELYKYYMHHKYVANDFLCPIAGINEGDVIELMFFRDVDDYAFSTIVHKDDDYVPLSKIYFNDNTMAFCKQTTDTYFKFPSNGNQHFPVEFHFDSNANGDRKIVLENDFYYDKEIIMAPNSTFKYFGFFVDEEECCYYEIDLGTKFNYCYDYNRYVVFYNGRRLSNDQYRLTIPCRTTTPFTRFVIYLAVPLSYQDRIDIFYLPDVIRDLDVDFSMTDTGLITYKKSDLEYLFGSKLYTFWINGKKIPDSYIKNLDSLSIQLKEDFLSKRHYKITKMGSTIDEIENAYKALDAGDILWDKAMAKYDGSIQALLGTNTTALSNVEDDAYDLAVPIQSIMWELIREHYIGNGIVDTTTNFIYDYLDQDTSALDGGKDKSGNQIIDAANANRNDNLDISRYEP